MFEGGFTLEAAEAVLDLSPWPEAPPAMDVVQALVDKSLLRTWVPAEQSRYDIEEPYFGMYISIHEYAAEKLAASGQPSAERAAEERHGRYFADVRHRRRARGAVRHGGVRRRRVLALELDNLVAALPPRRSGPRRTGRSRSTAYRAAWEVLELQGPCALGQRHSGAQVLAIDGLDACAARRRARTPGMVHAASPAARRRGGDMVERALALARAVGDRPARSGRLGHHGNLRRDQGGWSEPARSLEAALAIAARVGNRRAQGNLLGNLGNLHAEQGRLEEAGRTSNRPSPSTGGGQPTDRGHRAGNLGNACLDKGRVDAAAIHLTQALGIHREVGNRRDEAIALANLGRLRSGQHRSVEAHELYDAALTIAREGGYRPFEGYLLLMTSDELRDEGRIGEALARCEQAQVVLHDVRNTRHEGAALSLRGDLLAQLRRFDEARASLQAGEALLRKVGDQHALVRLLCARGHAEDAAGCAAAAREALAAAEALATASGVQPESEPGRALAALREALA